MKHELPYWRLSGFYLFYFAVLGTWLPFWSLYLKDLGYDAKAIGYLSAVMMATKIVAPHLWGWLADSSGRRMTVIRGGGLAGLLIFLAIFLRQDFWWLVMVIAGFSFFWNAILAQFEVVTLSHLHGQYERYSRVRVWGSIGFILAVVGLGALFDVVSIQYLPWIMSGMLALIWLSSLTVGEGQKRESSTDTAERQKTVRRGLGSVVFQPTVIAFLVVCFLLQIAHGPYYTFFSIYLENFGYSKTAIGFLWSLGVAAEVVLFLFMHKVLLQFSLRSIMLFALLMSTLRWLVIGYFAESLVLLLLAQLTHAFTFGAFHAISVEIIRKNFPDHQGQGMAMYSGISFGAGGATGAVISGWLWGWSAPATFAMASVASLVALVIAMIWMSEDASSENLSTALPN